MTVKFKAIIPKQANARAVYAALLDGMQKSTESPVAEFEKTTATWSGKRPSWRVRIKQENGTITVRIWPKGTVEALSKWAWLDRGTKPHMIYPKGDYPLRFRSGYQAKTRPGSFSSTSGGSYGDHVYARAVRHPGTEARGWSNMVVEKYLPKFLDAVRVAMKQAAKASGHGE